MTPEGKVKKSVKQLLGDHGAWFFMPVQYGYGARAVDFVGCHRSRFFAIETKAPGKPLTPLQRQCFREIREAGGVAFKIDGTDKTDTLETLRRFLEGNGSWKLEENEFP